jgi:hypothetical protein
MRVFSNWKADFFSSNPSTETAQLSLVAGAFFRWLREEVKKAGIVCDDSSRVRVALPALEGIERQKKELVNCMLRNGWPNVIEVVDEPKSNLIGVLSEGKNVVTAYGEISYLPTFGQGDAWGVINAMRQVALNVRNSMSMRISVVDLGSFTLDVATLIVDLDVVQHTEFPVREVCAKSWRIGVSTDIDRDCFPKLFQRHGVNGELLTQYEKETAKVELYAGCPCVLKARRVVLGGSAEDKNDVTASIARYCKKVCNNLADNCADSELIILTGGGMCIPAVRKVICNLLEKYGKHVLDFPNDAVLQTPRAGLHDWDSAGVGLGRLATALGGASIGLGFHPDKHCLRFFDRGATL